jgi:tetratricopeptide (TPR) repeat protein
MDEIDQRLDAAFAAFEAGRLDEAEGLCVEILGREPGEVAARHLRAVIAGRTGRAALAIELLREVVARDPAAADALSDLAHLLKEAGQLAEAIAVGEQAVALAPDWVAAHNNLGQAYLAADRAEEATACFERAIVLDPAMALLHYNLGIAHQTRGRDAEAVASYRQALAFTPDLAEAHARLGNLFYANGSLAEALASFRAAAAAQPDSSLGLACLATALLEERQAAAAESHLRRAIALDPAVADAHVRLGDVLNRSGRFAEAADCFERALALQPRHATAYQGLVSGRTLKEQDRPLLDRMGSLIAAGGLAERDRATLHFAMGKAHDDLGEHEAAMQHFDEANRLEAARLRRAGRSLDLERHAADVARLIGTFSPEFFARHAALGSESELPVLIVGMPRSGTTLVEQILSSHPEIGAGDELTFWGEKASALAEPEATALTPRRARQLAAEYLTLLRAIAPEARRVTDKMPQNYLHLGLIHMLFPRARIIHCRRNPIDTALSIYFTHFSLMRDFVFDRGGIVAYYEQYRRLTAHWRRVLPPDRFLEIDYEALVADRESVTRRMIAFCGLDWNDACLSSERNERLITTASMWQARQPVYKSSVERWRRYEPWLGEFRWLIPGTGSS